jgi:predicted TIM-barrel fold metal-dependent hydrolase
MNATTRRTMLIDAHTHVWHPMPDYPDLGATIVSPLADVPIELLDQYLDEHGVERAVLVQPMYPGEDNSYVADCAAARPDRYAAVCVVDPDRPGAAERLEYWVSERGCRGLRLRPHFAAEGESFGDAKTFSLWRKAEALDVVVSLLAGPEHLATVAELAGRFPAVRIVLDHMAFPDAVAGVDAAAFRALLKLALFENVHVKVSGYHHFSRQPYPYADGAPLFRGVVEHFGAERLIWGSDFPHVLLKCGYRRALALHERVHADLDRTALARIQGENAERVYWNANRR